MLKDIEDLFGIAEISDMPLMYMQTSALMRQQRRARR